MTPTGIALVALIPLYLVKGEHGQIDHVAPAGRALPERVRGGVRPHLLRAFGTDLTMADLIMIAHAHDAKTQGAVARGRYPVILDTDPLMSAVWADMLFGSEAARRRFFYLSRAELDRRGVRWALVGGEGSRRYLNALAAIEAAAGNT